MIPSVDGSASNNLLFLQHGHATCTSLLSIVCIKIHLQKANGNHLVHETKGNSSISANYYDRRSLGQWSRFSVRYWVKYPLLHNSFCWSQHVLKSIICSCLYYIESSWIAIGFSFFSLNLDIKLYIQRCLWVYNITHFLDFCPFVKYNKKGIQQ